jgi:hypothetical protein
VKSEEFLRTGGIFRAVVLYHSNNLQSSGELHKLLVFQTASTSKCLVMGCRHQNFIKLPRDSSVLLRFRTMPLKIPFRSGLPLELPENLANSVDSDSAAQVWRPCIFQKLPGRC